MTLRQKARVSRQPNRRRPEPHRDNFRTASEDGLDATRPQKIFAVTASGKLHVAERDRRIACRRLTSPAHAALHDRAGCRILPSAAFTRAQVENRHAIIFIAAYARFNWAIDSFYA
jgi:hypothetical protein